MVHRNVQGCRMMAVRKLDFQPAAYADGRKVMPIEQALAWAYQTELCSANETQLYGNGWNLDRVDCSTSSAWLAIADAAAARAVSPDALAMHDAVQRLETENWLSLDYTPEEWRGLLVDSYVPVIVDSWFVMAAVKRAATLVITHARLGNTPTLPDNPVPKPLRNVNGTPVIRRETTLRMKTVDRRDVGFQADEPVEQPTKTRGRFGIYPQGAKCELFYAPEFGPVATERADYLVWWLALDWLSQNIGDLERHVILPSELPMAPWKTLDSDLMT
jgi:hypothetical protein